MTDGEVWSKLSETRSQSAADDTIIISTEQPMNLLLVLTHAEQSRLALWEYSFTFLHIALFILILSYNKLI